MISLRESVGRNPGGGTGSRRKRDAGSIAASVALHAVLGAAILHVLLVPYPSSGESRGKSEPLRAERIGFLRLPDESPAVSATTGRAGGDGRPGRTRPRAPLVAPALVPTTIPPVAPGAGRPAEGSGPLIAAGGPVRGITPAYSDPRVWRAPGTIPTAPKSASQRLDSVIVAALQPYVDSVASRRGAREPGDWTVEKNGQKYGIDRKFIRLGPVSIPTALLALLPLNVQGNPSVMEREKTLNALNRDIVYHANRGMNEADFRKAVRSIRERKERERAAAQVVVRDENKKDRPAN